MEILDKFFEIVKNIYHPAYYQVSPLKYAFFNFFSENNFKCCFHHGIIYFGYIILTYFT